MRAARLAWLIVVPLGLSGCQLSNHNALAPAGLQASRIHDLFWGMAIVCAAVWITVLTFGGLAFLRGRRRLVPAEDEDTNARMRRGVILAVAATTLILIGFLVADFGVGRATGAYSAEPKEALSIQVIGHQWWWQIVYEDSIPERTITTANEIHIPIGRPVLIKAESRDVIHSFWVPNLAGKRDLIPGYSTMLWLRADEPGVYEGRCAEYCGHQHAKMRLTVVAETAEQFSRWYEQSRQPARPPADAITRRGQEVFLAGPCVMCHTIRGTPAGGTLGPELTHVASRRTLAAGSLPNTRGHLAAWIADAQRIKPGNLMPPIALPPGDLEALLAYLESLR